MNSSPMAAVESGPERILAILLGAGRYEGAPTLAQGPSFTNSGRDFHNYLKTVLRLSEQNVKWLFDDPRYMVEQLVDVGNFLDERSRELKATGAPPTDLIVYYIGHGMFCGLDRAYHLAIRATEAAREGLTSIRVSELAQALKDHGRFLRKFLILDCCFAGAAYQEFLSSPLEVSRTQLVNELPGRGTAILCAASAKEAAIAPQGLARTMFSDSLLKSLEAGHPGLGSRMSLSDLGTLVRQHIKDTFPESWVRPEVHCPDQKEGDVADVALFPNPAAARQEALLVAQRQQGPREAPQERVGGAAARKQAEVERKEPELEEARRRAEEDRRAADARLAKTRAQEARTAELLRQEQQAKREEQARFYAAERRRADEAARKLGIVVGAVFVTILVTSVIVSVFMKLFVPSAGVVTPSQLPRQLEQPRVSIGTGAPASRTNQDDKDCDVCPEMVNIPAGQFTMGSPSDELGRDSNEGPAHNVQVPAFSLGKYDVTFDEWDACVAAGGCKANRFQQMEREVGERALWKDGGGVGRRPVISVSWYDAQDYVHWLSQKTQHAYRLPSEAEWEYAARAHTTTPYYWGPAIVRGIANCGSCDSGQDFGPAPVGKFAPNPWGLYDMAGNVKQWVQDCDHRNYDSAPPDGGAWMTGCDSADDVHIVRGGSYHDLPSELRSAHRSDHLAGFGELDLGFRVASGPRAPLHQ